MVYIEGIKIQNFKVLKDVTLGRLWNLPDKKPLKELTAVIGKNGAGKSTLFDAFSFLADCLKHGVEDACYKQGRGGFDKIRSQGVNDSINFEIYYREKKNERPITYELSIDIDKNGRPYAKKERLRQRRKNQSSGKPFSFLILDSGKGYCWTGDGVLEKLDNSLYYTETESPDKENVELSDITKLGIATLGSLKKHPRISLFREFMEGWYLSYFTPDAARDLPRTGPQKHLSIHGDNLGNVVQYMENKYSSIFENILKKIAEKIPGINKISTLKTQDDRLLLCFNDNNFKDPFYAQQVSDGTLKMFAYLLLLEDPDPPPLIGIEEPENGLYQDLLESLAIEFRNTAIKTNGSQLFVTTHHPNFVDALDPEEVWILEKQEDGFSSVKRASENIEVVNMVENGLTLGSLWYSNHLNVR